jgi:hypothetical protein
VNRTSTKYLLVILNYILPLVIDIIYRFTKAKIDKAHIIYERFKLMTAIVDILFKFRYIFDTKFIHSSFLEYLLKLMLVNQGSKEAFSDKFLNIGKQLNLFFLFMVMRLGQWYYNKDKIVEDTTINISAPKRTKKADNICTLCKNEITDPMVSKCCGTVTCESCINTYIQTHNKCSSCNDHIATTQLVKIFI